MSRASCRGDDGDLMETWTRSNACWSLYYNMMYNKNGRPEYNAEGAKIVNSDVTRLLENYSASGLELTEPGLKGYNVFQDVILRICNAYPGSCQDYLQPYCAPKTDIQSNRGLINFCGCYTEQQEYGGNVSKQCQPLCNRVSNVKLPNGTGSVLSCTDNVCVIDNVSIQASTTENSGNVSFTQVCRCPEGQCKCIIGSVNLYGITGETQFKQVCGEDSLCYAISDNPNDPPVLVGCPVILEPETLPTSEFNPYIIWLIVFIVLVLVLIIFII